MADATLIMAQESALILHGVSAELVPIAGSGPVTCRGVLRPERDEVAEFPELRGVLGAERPAWAFAIPQSDLAVRPVSGDRVTIEDDWGTLQLRGVRSDPHGLWWLTSGFLVVDEDEVSDLEPGIYMPAGLGFSTAGSLL